LSENDPDKTREIRLTVRLDENRVPEAITWDATERDAGTPSACDAAVLALWNRETKSAFRIDLWTKSMPVDEMSAFLVQTIHTLADTYERATSRERIAGAIRRFAHDLGRECAGEDSS